MRGSGSHDVHVKDAFVPDNHILPSIGSARSDQPLMRFPTGRKARLQQGRGQSGSGARWPGCLR